MSKLSFFNKIKSPIARKLLFTILISSTIITSFIIAIQLFYEYKIDVKNIQNRINQIENSYTQSLALSIWNFNKNQYNIQLDGILNLEDIVYVEILTSDNEKIISKGKFQNEKIISKEFLLETIDFGDKVISGKLVVQASLKRVYDDLYNRALIILFTQGIKTLLISFVVLWAFYMLVTRYLFTISSYTKNINFDNDDKLILQKDNNNDELDDIVFTLNDMQDKINKGKQELLNLNINLENKVSEQTKIISAEYELKKFYLNSVNSLIIALDNNGNVTMINSTGCNILGFKEEEIIGKNWFEIGVLKKDNIAKIKEYFFKIISDEILIIDESYENELISKNKNEYIFAWSNSLIKQNGKIVGVLSSGNNITKERKQEKFLKEQSKMVAMGEMIGNIAHQWRQPLSAISTASTGMLMQKEYGILTDELFIQSCDAINNNAQYLSKTIDDFRNFIKGDRTKKIFSLKDDINSFLYLVEGTIKSNNINIILNLTDDIKIDGYENELTQCLINIFNNSKDALIDTENNKYVFISTIMVNKKVIIKIKDNAGGISNDIINKIFEPYFTTKHQSQGTGLGLHITYNLIVDGMSGTIEVNNVEFEYGGKDYVGAEFVVSLPME